MSRHSSAGHRSPRPKRYKKAGPIAWLISLAALGACFWLLFQLVVLDILPAQMLLIVTVVVLLILLLLIMCWLFKARRPFAKGLCALLVIALGCTYAVGGKYIADTSAMFNEVSNLTDKMAMTVTTYVMTQTGVETPANLQNAVIGVSSSSDSQGTAGAVQQLKDEGATFTEVEYSSPYALVDALYDGEVDAICFPEQYHGELNDAANDDNKYNALTTFTNNVDQYIYYVDRTEILKNPSDPVENIMTDPFTVLISGSDNYGTLSTTSRSDVNMLVAVNPSTAQILIVSIPRDTYTEISCKKNTNACAAVEGMDDKVTHSGIYGIGTTESTIEDLLGVSVNYTVRVNFSSLINLVDAMGGIDVEVEPGLEVDTFYSNGTEGVHAGVNHLDGERALAFSRERYAYADGDNQRVKNQQIVMKALIQAMMSPSMVVNYPKVMKALSTAFETNMSAQEMKSLLTLELMRFPKWNVQSYPLFNTVSDTAYSPVVGDYTAVTYADASQLAYVRELVDQLRAGETLNVSQDGAASITTQDDQDSDYDSSDQYSQDAQDNWSGNDFYDDGTGSDEYGNNGVYDWGNSDWDSTDDGQGSDYGYNEDQNWGTPVDNGSYEDQWGSDDSGTYGY